MTSLASGSIFSKTFVTDFAQATEAEKAVVLRQVWQVSAKVRTDEAATCKAFSRHLFDEINNTRHQRESFTVCTLDAIVRIVQDLLDSQAYPLEEVLQRVKANFRNVDDNAIQRSVELCTRLWLTVNVNSSLVAVGGTSLREIPLDWPRSSSLKDVVEGAFADRSRKTGSNLGMNVDGSFTADYFVKNCGIELVWTNYLTDHLRLDPSRRVLMVYRHKVFLSAQLHGGLGSLIPEDVSREALDTINLLFPFGDPSTKHLLVKHGEVAIHDLGNCGRERTFDLSVFKYWREELEILAKLYHSPPQTLRQLAFDRRHRLELSAFCITAMVALLTLISIPCTIIQAVYSVKAYHVAVAQSVGVPRSEL